MNFVLPSSLPVDFWMLSDNLNFHRATGCCCCFFSFMCHTLAVNAEVRVEESERAVLRGLFRLNRAVAFAVKPNEASQVDLSDECVDQATNHRIMNKMKPGFR